MGTDSPNSFTHSDNKICINGLLLSICNEAGEAEICHEICALIQNSSSASCKEITPTDCEFINMSGKRVSVSQCKDGFEWGGRALKELCGSGSVYVCITKCCDQDEADAISSDVSCDDFDISIPECPVNESTVSFFTTLVDSDDYSSHGVFFS